MAIAVIVFDQALNLGIPGLNAKLEKAGYKLKPEDMAFFLNKKMRAFKIVWGGQYLLHFKKTEGKITVAEVRMLPRFFKGRGILNAKFQRQLETKLGAIHIKQVGT